MSKYTLNLFGKTTIVSKQTFFLFAVPIVCLLLGYVWCWCGGIYRFGETFFNAGGLTLCTAFIIFGSITINEVRYALIPENIFTKYMIRLLSLMSVLYYFYHIDTYGF